MFVKLLYFQINQWLSRFTSPTKFMFCDPISQSTPDHICLQRCTNSQIWIAVSIYVLVAIIKKRLNLDASLYTLLQILSVTLFEKMPIQQALQGISGQAENTDSSNQLNLFDS